MSFFRKLTENKFKPGLAKPELVEDWDQVNEHYEDHAKEDKHDDDNENEDDKDDNVTRIICLLHRDS